MGFFKRLFGFSSGPAVPAAATGSVPVEIPPPPSGFTWHVFEPARMTVLRPEAWYVHEVGNNERFTGCVSKECIQTEGGFTTGLTLNVIRQFKDRVKRRNPDYHPDLPVGAVVESLYPSLLADPRFQVLYLDQGVQRTPNSRLFRFRYRKLVPTQPDLPWRGAIVCQKLIIEFDQSPDVYHFTFESPESSWDEHWTIGKQILTSLVFSANPSTSFIFSVDPPLAPDDLLQAKALEVGRELGWSLAHDDRTEGLFIWRIDLAVRFEDGSRSNHAGTFAWCMKRVGNEIQLYDPVNVYPSSGASEDGLGAMNAAARELQEDFKRRWLALVGPVTLREASPEMIDLGLKAAIQVAETQGWPTDSS